MKSFEFSTTQRIVFGIGSLEKLPTILAEFGARPLLVVGYKQWKESGILQYFDSSPNIVEITDEPTIGVLREIIREVALDPPDVVIGIGGGSALDTAKAISALITNPGDITDYLEVIGKGESIRNQPLPVIAIPTTAGTGSEATFNAVLGSPEHRIKVSLRNKSMLPCVALIDPGIQLSLPPSVTAFTGLDALTQVIEPFVSGFANPITDAFCKEGIHLIKTGLYSAFQNGQDIEARQDMALASLFGGIALANARLGAVHGIAGPFGGMFKSEHGAVCGILLPAVIKANIKALKTRDPENPALDRYQQIAVLITGNPSASREDGQEAIQDMVAEMKIPKLSSYGFSLDDFKPLIESSRIASSMKGNPISLTTAELEMILMDAL